MAEANPMHETPPSILLQRRFFQTRRLELDPEGVRFEWKAFLQKHKYLVRYEEILRDPIEFTEEPKKMEVVDVLLITMGLGFLYGAAVAGAEEPSFKIALIAFGVILLASFGVIRYFGMASAGPLLQLSNGAPALVLFAGRPTDEELEGFLEALATATNQHLLENYGSGHPGESKANQLDRLWALHEAGALSKEEFESLKAELIYVPEPEDTPGHYL